MTWPRSIVMDLMEKRLWPVAALLAAGAVALPVAARVTAPTPPVSGSGASFHRSVAAGLGLSPDLQVRLAATAPDAGADRTRGVLHDPFVGTAASTSTVPPSPSSARSGGSSPLTSLPGRVSSKLGPGTTPSTGSRGAVGPTISHTVLTHHAAPVKHAPVHVAPHPVGHPHAPIPAAQRALNTYAVTMRFGQGTTLSTLGGPLRLTPLVSDPAHPIILLGVLGGAQSVDYLLGPGITATGDGGCSPTPTSCEVLTLKPGDTEFLDVPTATGLVQYELDLVSVRVSRARSVALALRAHRQESAAGRALLAQSRSTALSKLEFSQQLGIVRPRTSAAHSARRLPVAAAPLVGGAIRTVLPSIVMHSGATGPAALAGSGPAGAPAP